MLVPEQFGGLALSFVDVALVIEELGKALVGSPVCDTLVAADLLVRHGTDAQRARWLPRIAAGQLRAVIAFSEPGSGFAIEDIDTRAKVADSGWLLDGHKILVPDAAAADLVLLIAKFGAEQEHGLAVIEPGRRGVEIRDHVTIDPTCRMSSVTCTAVELREEDRLGGSGADVRCVARLLDLSATVAALQMTGIAVRVLELAIAYAAQRVQFGRPIGSFQAIKHKCADMAVAVEGSRSAVYFAAWAAAESETDFTRAASMAKSFCGDAARMVCNEGTQIHGGMGFTWELGLHFYLRRAKLLEYSFGDASFHRERVLATTLGKQGLAG